MSSEPPTASHRHSYYPFNTSLPEGGSVREWWERFLFTENAGLLAAIAIKLDSIIPHSMADERTASIITWLNSARRGNMDISTIFAQAQIRQFYRSDPKVRPSARPKPAVKFHEIEKLTHERQKEHEDMLHTGEDESDTDDELVNEPPITSDEDEQLVLEGGESEINLEAAGIEDVLAAEERGSAEKASKADTSVGDAGIREEDDGEYEIESWV